MRIHRPIGTLDEQKEKLLDLIQQARNTPGRCSLCVNPATKVGLFIPDNSQTFGAPQGKQRFFLYRMCEACLCLPNWSELLDDLLLADATQEMN